MKALDTALTILKDSEEVQVPVCKKFITFSRFHPRRRHNQHSASQGGSNYSISKTHNQDRASILPGFYRKFVPGFASIAAPLHSLTGHSAPKELTWTPQAEEAFTTLKKKMTSAPALVPARMDYPFILQTDASDVGLGAVLAQEYHGEEQPIAFFSRRLNKAEQNYSTTEKECLAVVEGVKAFALYLIGSVFTIVTDHAALKSLQTTTKSGPRVTRWALALQPFNFSIVHRAGKKHQNADGLSRQAWDREPMDSPVCLWRDQTGDQKGDQSGWQTWCLLRRKVPRGRQITLGGDETTDEPKSGEDALALGREVSPGKGSLPGGGAEVRGGSFSKEGRMLGSAPNKGHSN